MTIGIIACGAYLPIRRLQRSEVAKAHEWLNPALQGLAKGERCIANWDEDSVTMAVEASRDCLIGRDRNELSGVYMASTSFPFTDRQNAGIVADALNLPASLSTLDVASSQRAGTTALSTALQIANAHNGPLLVTAAERRPAAAASPYEMTLGDAAAALLVGTADTAAGETLLAKALAWHTESVDFVDHYRSQEQVFDYGWEERWVRDEGYLKIVPNAVAKALQKAAVDADQITHFCFPSATQRVAASVATACGIAAEKTVDNLSSNCGEAGAAHPLLLLIHTLESAAVGDTILAAGFGQGCDAMVFEVTAEISSPPPSDSAAVSRLGVTGHLVRRRAEANYHRYLAHNNLVTIERGIRAEVDRKTGLSTLNRNRESSQRMIGGLCSACGTAQFPKSRICVNPECTQTDTQCDEPFAEKLAQLNSFTADRLTYSPDPPAWYGMVQFNGGGRLMADFADIAADATLEVGMPMRMMFRVKDFDRKRGFRRYFWKATAHSSKT